MWEKFKAFLKRYEWARMLLAWGVTGYGLVSLWGTITAVVASAATTVWAVTSGISLPLALMGGVCMLAASIYLAMVPLIVRALRRFTEVPIQTPTERVKPNYALWQHVEAL